MSRTGWRASTIASGPCSRSAPLNAWAALTITLVLTAVLLADSLGTLRALHARAEASARERDEALRRSIGA